MIKSILQHEDSRGSRSKLLRSHFRSRRACVAGEIVSNVGVGTIASYTHGSYHEVNPAFLNMIREVIKFGKKAPEVLEPRHAAKFDGVTLGEYLKTERYSKFFADNYVVPMCAAIWSCSNKDTMAFPIVTLIRFWVNHHLLNIIERPLWRVVKGRSKAYVVGIRIERAPNFPLNPTSNPTAHGRG